MLKRFVKTVLCSLFATLMVFVAGSSVCAQSSPLSPWMGMFDRPNNPALGSYLGNVRPQQNMQKAYSAQMSQIQAQQQALQALSRSSTTAGGTTARDLVGGSTGTSAGLGAAGGATNARDTLAPPREVPRVNQNPAGFNQYLHYYPQRSMPRQPVPNYSVTGRRR